MVSQRHMLLQKQEGLAHWYEMRLQLLCHEGGALFAVLRFRLMIMAATNWAGHTTRGLLSGALKKNLGLTIKSAKVEGRGRAYMITED